MNSAPQSRSAGDDQRQIIGVLNLIQELARLIHSDSHTDLFRHAFDTLFAAVPFDVAVTIMLEQNLDLYIAARSGGAGEISDPLIAQIRKVLQTVIPPSFAAAELVVKSERHDLPAREGVPPNGFEHEAHTILRQENRTAGILFVARATAPFSTDELAVLDIFATQVSMLMDGIAARAKIFSLAEVDELTGVANRRLFRRNLSAEIERARVYSVSLALLLIDIDDFKEINDTLGHVTGDVVLSELCGTVRETLRSPDSISRWGGDEFAVILPHTDAAGACSAAQRILDCVRNLTISAEDGSLIRCSVSVGVTQLDNSVVTADDFVRAADERLYAAKRAGKNRYMF